MQNGPARGTRYARALVRRLMSRRTMFRGKAFQDGDVTLLTVNWNTTQDTIRLLRSWERFCAGTKVVVVENGSWAARREIKRSSPRAKVVGGVANLHHGLGLDYGLRYVRSEFVVICDPDSIIISSRFLLTVTSMVRQYGIASIDVGVPQYSPMCLAFRVADWKKTTISMEESFPAHDVAGALTIRHGGVNPAALLEANRKAETNWGSSPRIYGDVYSNMVGAARRLHGPDAFAPTEGPFEKIVEYQEKWRNWADGFLSGDAHLEDFPL